jgi:hypothetical protein
VKNGDALQYLLIENGYIIIKRFDAEEEAIRQVEEKRLIPAKLTAPQCK